MRYADDAARLAQALARLTMDGATPSYSLLGQEPSIVLAARDAVIAGLDGLARELVVVASQAGREPADVATLVELEAGFREMPRVSAGTLSLDRALGHGSGSLIVRQWQEAARAASVLEIYRGAVCASDVDRIASDVAAMAAALPALDADLARLLPSRSGQIHDSLTDRLAHEHLAHVAAGVQESKVHSGLEQPLIPRVHPVRNLEAVPTATLHLAELIRRRGADMTMHEARAVARALATGIALALKVDPARTVGTGLRPTLGALQGIIHAELATLSEPSPRLMALAEGIRAQLTNQLRSDVVAQQLSIAQVDRWRAGPLARAAGALANSLGEAERSGNLLARSGTLNLPTEQQWMRLEPPMTARVESIVALNKCAHLLATDVHESTPVLRSARASFSALQTAMRRRSLAALPNNAGARPPVVTAETSMDTRRH